jgi:hypothetical protein
MFLETSPSLRELIVRALAHFGPLRAQDLRREIERHHRSCSLQGVYLELTHLVEAGVIVKGQRYFELSVPWVCRLTQFADDTGDTFFQRERRGNNLPEEGEVLQVTFSQVRRADAFWMQSVLSVLSANDDKRLFQWLPHPWYHLTQSSPGNDFETALRRLKAKDFVIVGGDTYLDRLATADWAPDIFTYSHAAGPFHAKMNEPGSLVGNFIIRTIYSAKFMHSVDRYFTSVKRARDIVASDVLTLFGERMKLTVRIENDPMKAKRLRGKYLRYFGERE